MPDSTPSTRLTRGMHERLLYIDHLLRRKKPVTAEAVGRHFHVSGKTVRKDMAYLRDRMERPLEFDERRNTWLYTEDIGPLPDQVITEGEVFVLMVARAALEPYRGMRFIGASRTPPRRWRARSARRSPSRSRITRA